MRPRSADRTRNLDRTADFIHGVFAAAGARVSEESFVARGKTFRNVIAQFGPTAGGRTVIGAHYDAFTSTGDLPGADDNASGTAAVLELAALLGRRPPSKSVELVAFTTEEPPFFGSEQMGSWVHADHLAHSAIVVDRMICLEMIGYYRGTQNWSSVLYRALYPTDGNFIAVAGGWNDRKLAVQLKAAIRGAGMRVFSFTGPRDMLDASDQRNFWQRGWRAVMVTDTAFVRNPNYHTARDTADTLDYENMARVVDGLFSFVSR